MIDFFVPQGSCAGPVLYSIYASTLQTVIPEGINLNGFVDDHNVKKNIQSWKKGRGGRSYIRPGDVYN